MTSLSDRNKANKRKGAAWETELLGGLRSVGEDAERLRLTGAEDEGDLVVREFGGRYLVIETKNAKFEPGPFLNEAERERLNFARHRGLDENLVDSIVIVKRRGANWRRAYVLTTVERYFELGDE